MWYPNGSWNYGFGWGRGFSRGFGRGWGAGFGRGWGRGNPYPSCMAFPWLPRGWRWGATGYYGTSPYYGSTPYYGGVNYPYNPYFGYGYGVSAYPNYPTQPINPQPQSG